MKRICSECGCPVEDGDVFCPDCGHKLEPQAQEQKQQKQQQEQRQQHQSQQQAKHGMKSVTASAQPVDAESAAESVEPYRTFSELFWDCEFYKIFKGKKFDFGQRVFELGAFCWETIKVAWQTTTRRLFIAKGRATRREFWSFTIGSDLMLFLGGLYLAIVALLLLILGFILPLGDVFFLILKIALGAVGIFYIMMFIASITIAIRRMHDINRCGWWILLPIIRLFLFFKRSDDGENDYGAPSNIL